MKPLVAFLGSIVLLFSTVAPAPNATAHTCVDLSPAACDPANCPDRTYHDHFVIDPTLSGLHERCISKAQNCQPQSAHSYHTFLVDQDLYWRSINGGEVIVSHATTADCDGDGLPGGWDGDYEHGIGGAFFGWGPWADEPICKYGLNVHGLNIFVQDAFFSMVPFTIGENDQFGPSFITNPINHGEVLACETDGTLSPAVDPDDCLSPAFIGVGTTCGTGGGDGGFWVFLDPPSANVNGGGVDVSVSATLGTITAF